MFSDLTSLIASGRYIAAVGLAIVALVGVLRVVLAIKVPWFKTKLGGYVLGYGSAALIYAGAALHQGIGVSLELVVAAIGAGWASSGGWETFRDVIGWLGNASSGGGSGDATESAAKTSLVVSLFMLVMMPLTMMLGLFHRTTPPRARFIGRRIAFAAVLVALPLSLTSCGLWHSKPATAVIDCLSADQAQIAGLAGELTPLITGDHVDWSAIYSRAKDAGKVIGGCVLSELVQEYLGGKKAVSTDDSWNARKALEDFRAKEAGGATFHTKLGDL